MSSSKSSTTREGGEEDGGASSIAEGREAEMGGGAKRRERGRVAVPRAKQAEDERVCAPASSSPACSVCANMEQA